MISLLIHRHMCGVPFFSLNIFSPLRALHGRNSTQFILTSSSSRSPPIYFVWAQFTEIDFFNLHSASSPWWHFGNFDCSPATFYSNKCDILNNEKKSFAHIAVNFCWDKSCWERKNSSTSPHTQFIHWRECCSDSEWNIDERAFSIFQLLRSLHEAGFVSSTLLLLE